MSFDWADYLRLAQFLQSQSAPDVNQEAIYRCAVSRAYYAAFCHARNYARDRHGFIPRYTGDDHGVVKRHFLSRRERGVAIKLENLRNWRNLYDYADSIKDLSGILNDALTEAQKIIAILK